VPILQGWALGGLKALGFRGRVRLDPHRDYFYLGAWLADEGAAVPVSAEARDSFERAFGVAPDAQMALEESLVNGMDFADLSKGRYETLVAKRFAHWEDLVGVSDDWRDRSI